MVNRKLATVAVIDCNVLKCLMWQEKETNISQQAWQNKNTFLLFLRIKKLLNR